MQHWKCCSAVIAYIRLFAVIAYIRLFAIIAYIRLLAKKAVSGMNRQSCTFV